MDKLNARNAINPRLTRKPLPKWVIPLLIILVIMLGYCLVLDDKYGFIWRAL
jgi:hypothetical protein